MAHDIAAIETIERGFVLDQPVGLISVKAKPGHASVDMQHGWKSVGPSLWPGVCSLLAKYAPACQLFKIIQYWRDPKCGKIVELVQMTAMQGHDLQPLIAAFVKMLAQLNSFVKICHKKLGASGTGQCRRHLFCA